MDADLPHTLEAIKTMRLLATLTDQIEDPSMETKEEYQSFRGTFQWKESINISKCLNLAQTFGKSISSIKPYGLKVFNLVSQFHILRFSEVAKTLQDIIDLKCGLSGDFVKGKILKEASSGWAQSLEVPMQYAIPSEVIEAGKELAKHGLEKEAKNIAEVPLEAS